jgi:ribonuclease T2
MAGSPVVAQAQAQAYECRPPKGPISIPREQPDGPVRQLPITAYSLALSWSPEYCRTRKTGPADTFQCGGRNGRFGLVLHGLWPESRDGVWPQWCPTKRAPSPELIRRNMCMTPSASLLAHEWAKHGACMARKPETYFRISSILMNSLRFPDLDSLSRRDDLDAGKLREAMVAANPAFSTEQVGIRLSRNGWLQEVLLCYGKDFLPTRCMKGQFGAANAAKVKIWRGL